VSRVENALRDPVLGYTVAVLFTGMALLLFLLVPTAQSIPFVFFFAAVAVTARLCGFGPALLATLLSAVMSDYFFMGPHFTFSRTADDLTRLASFVTVSIVIASIARKQSVTETELSVTQRRLLFSQRAAMLGSWEWDLQSGTLWWSEGIWLLHGHSVGQVEPSFESWLNFAITEDRTKLESAVQNALKRKRPYEVEYRCIWPDGSFHWI